MTRLIIHAPNIHQGGGAVLLRELIASVPYDSSLFLQVDARFNFPADIHPDLKVIRFRRTLLAQFRAEVSLFKIVCRSDHVLCFGNLPPLFRLKSDPMVFLQNRYLVDRDAPVSALPLKTRLRLYAEKLWLKLFVRNAGQLIVQTPSMQNLAKEFLGIHAMCFPFFPNLVKPSEQSLNNLSDRKYDFIYVASGEAHKNHLILIKAWKLLFADGLVPSLAVTLSKDLDPDLCTHLEKEKRDGLNIYNLGTLSHNDLIAIYLQSGALIYPSSFESFGLPLIEAKRLGLPVLAPELDYVRDVIDPDETFDCHSPLSIERAVRRHLEGRRELPALQCPKTWINHFVNGVSL
jgi:glycosyltransferase involved in cell wall biosynthesis